MDTDAWGIVNEYQDAMGHIRATSDQTREAIRRSMGDIHPQTLAEGPPVRVIRQGEGGHVPGALKITLEDGSTRDGHDWLPGDLPLGYHQLEASGRGRPLRLIVAPRQCYLPEGIRTWGWVTQLYATRSRQSWGIGDLADLRRLAQWAGSEGAGVLLVNPLGAGAPTLPQEPSPYYPNSRLFRSLLYLRIEDVPGAGELGELLTHLQNAGRALNNEPAIQRDPIYALKREALEKLWSRFGGDAGFDRYVVEQGAPLRQYAAYCVIAERHGCDWHRWPEEYRRPDTPGATRLSEEAGDRLRFHAWVQWLIDEQLRRAGSELPLVLDLPVGFDAGGADGWAWQDLLAQGISVGAPPDLYNTQGQNWGLPPFIPHKLQETAYEPFIDTIRAALRHARGLRIDHILGFFRLFWIPWGASAEEGTYVRYPADDLLAILALESERSRAIIAGEDLGTVEEYVRRTLGEHRLLSYRILYFEPVPPTHYPYLSLAAITTHDLPTVAGLWSGCDFEAQQRLGMCPSEEQVRGTREQLKRLAGVGDHASTEEVVAGAHRALAEAPSALVTATLEDAMAVQDRPNMPGITPDKWPNWSKALPLPLEDLEQSDLARTISGILREHRHAPATTVAGT